MLQAFERKCLFCYNAGELIAVTLDLGKEHRNKRLRHRIDAIYKGETGFSKMERLAGSYCYVLQSTLYSENTLIQVLATFNSATLIASRNIIQCDEQRHCNTECNSNFAFRRPATPTQKPALQLNSYQQTDPPIPYRD